MELSDHLSLRAAGTAPFTDSALADSAVGPPPLPVLDAPWRIRVMEPGGADLDLIHQWMLQPHVEAGWHQAWPKDRWADELTRHLAGAHARPCLLYDRDEPIAYLELYRVVRDRLVDYYEAAPHDLGIHVAIGDSARTGRGLGRAVLRAVADGLLAAEPACRRILAEPNVENAASLRAFALAGFQTVGEIRLPHKTAAVLVRPRAAGDLPRLRHPDNGGNAATTRR